MNNKEEIKLFKYRTYLNELEAEHEIDKIVIYYLGERKIIDCMSFTFNSKTMLSVAQVEEKIKGTKGIDRIEGDFIDDTTPGDNKYYTPELKEFHIGFEYEFHGMTTGGLVFMDFKNNKSSTVHEPTNKVWNKEIVNLDLMYSRSLSDIDKLIIDKKIRVKYLDKKDIESQGYIHKKYKQDEYSEMRIYIGKKFEVQFFGWDISVENKHLRGRIDIYLQDEPFFRGTVKNISKFKEVLETIKA